ncbi:MAG TPA: hypothetical protein VM008_19290 [Phycisphaerae bacterium]|nr:hypothetical protein [Phycisphaerae bacterium]
MIEPSFRTLPFEFSREHLLLPLNSDGGSGIPVRCLTAGVHTDAALDNLSLFLDAPLELIPTPEAELRDAITRTYQEQMAHSDALRQTSPSNTPEPDRLTVQEALHSLTDRDLLASGDKAPVAKLVDALLFDALTKQASDLHVHPYPNTAPNSSSATRCVRPRAPSCSNSPKIPRNGPHLCPFVPIRG